MVLEGQECRGALVGVLFAIFISGITLALLSRSLLIGVLIAAVGLWAWVWFSIVTGGVACDLDIQQIPRGLAGDGSHTVGLRGHPSRTLERRVEVTMPSYRQKAPKESAEPKAEERMEKKLSPAKRRKQERMEAKKGRR